jgi:BirA family biotin operon repressor/biotin-[acetyl-CoA-carboxylase] ligase
MARKLGFKTFRYDTVDSTNDLLKGLAADGIEPGAVVTARIQTGGKGRMGRRWESPEGGLWMSVLLDAVPALRENKFGLLPLMAGASVASAIAMEYGLDASVKWPNDVLVGGRKACGILGELFKAQGRDLAVMGIGVNVNNRIRNAGYEFSGASTSIMEEFGRDAHIETLEVAILEELGFRLELLEAGEHRKILDDWRQLSSTLGREVSVSTPSGIVKGVARDIDDDGSLLLESGGRTVTVMAGDCTHLG